MTRKNCWQRLLVISCIVIIMISTLSACNSVEDWELVDAEVIRTGKYSTGTSTKLDDLSIDFIDLDSKNIVTNIKINRNYFYRLRTGDIIKIRRSQVKDNMVTYCYLESDNLRDIDNIDKENRTEITSEQVNARVIIKKRYRQGRNRYKSLAYILDTELDQVVTLYNVSQVWGLLTIGDTIRVQRDSMEYNGETYYHYYILYERT